MANAKPLGLSLKPELPPRVPTQQQHHPASMEPWGREPAEPHRAPGRLAAPPVCCPRWEKAQRTGTSRTCWTPRAYRRFPLNFPANSEAHFAPPPTNSSSERLASDSVRSILSDWLKGEARIPETRQVFKKSSILSFDR